jgi:predicted metal-dependent enzyme (double-stranded beta helix superfamily)
MSAVPSQTPARPHTQPRIEFPSPTDLVRLVRATAADTHRWRSVLRLPDGNDRWWTLMSANDDVDVWLLSWRPGQATDLHDHGSSAAALTVIHGELNEVRIDPYGRATSHSRPAGTATSLAPAVIHDVSGAGVDAAVSIHAYSPPLREMNYYTPDAHGHLQITRTVSTHEPEQELTE